ncbi:up-regulator of cell proliferation-like [Mugil cephalus]|uniref:up-regulator of cell proliferation-like n=1 Tax=Mugil cephalus TaxID=48193 RepID=UPI001FB5FB15|nr:up-regulator of cell proliferation-like [Mugil cephalus]XP_047439822.1 up-regulator of cell proliferation-like [Mugil cephalus]XP_047439831.1 up-regulator of cell proliferation-like [Mugil cephalus]XP_047439841.1 up-regulator of cell proliferation-like [Mugil cephalus]
MDAPVGAGQQHSFQDPEEMEHSMSSPDVTFAHPKTHLEMLLEDMGLDHYYRDKLTLKRMLQIDEKTITDEQPAMSKTDLAWHFLKKLVMVNVSARNVNCTFASESNCDAASEVTQFDFDDNAIFDEQSSNMLNPLDLITALFLCSDGFVQQEMTLKMSMCQFSVPLLLPNSDTQQCTLMLWAMRDIVKKYRPQSLSDSKGFIEERIVLSELPMVSFVRLGECTLSKSEILNKLLSNSHQYHDTFVHHNMEGGDSPRRISNGLTEITWYLPGGNNNMDIFSEPVAVANLRGDIASFKTQYSFLCHTSAAVFVFFDNLDSGCNLLTNRTGKAQIFLVGNHNGKNFSLEALRKVAAQLGLTKNNIILKTKQKNYADFVKSLRKAVSDVVENSQAKMRIEQMADIAHELGILVDEDASECKNGKKNADAITEEIQDF